MATSSDSGAREPDGFADVALPGGKRLTVRSATSADVEGLSRLYGNLPPEDLRSRFFSYSRPPQQWLEGWACDRGDGGVTLVAVASNGDEQIVGEAGYSRRPDGDGDLGLAVVPHWRGWLGPFLLDALLQVAATRDVPNLQADILVQNRRMLELVRARGCASPGQDDIGVVRVVIGTGGRAPSWPPGHELPRVLVEAPGGHWRAEAQARGAGLQVMVCSGPRPGRPARCPALMGEPCPLAAGADAIVFALPTDDAAAAEVLGAHGVVHRDVPLCVDTGSAGAGTWPVPPGALGISEAATAQEAAELVRRLVGRDDERQPPASP
jgi:hypothetical protein